MTYDEAVTIAKAGQKVRRKHWCDVELAYSPHNNKLFLDDGDERQGYKPSEENKAAIDWIKI